MTTTWHTRAIQFRFCDYRRSRIYYWQNIEMERLVATCLLARQYVFDHPTHHTLSCCVCYCLAMSVSCAVLPFSLISSCMSRLCLVIFDLRSRCVTSSHCLASSCSVSQTLCASFHGLKQVLSFLLSDHGESPRHVLSPHHVVPLTHRAYLFTGSANETAAQRQQKHNDNDNNRTTTKKTQWRRRRQHKDNNSDNNGWLPLPTCFSIAFSRLS
jgi:hypothetical protein